AAKAGATAEPRAIALAAVRRHILAIVNLLLRGRIVFIAGHVPHTLDCRGCFNPNTPQLLLHYGRSGSLWGARSFSVEGLITRAFATTASDMPSSPLVRACLL